MKALVIRAVNEMGCEDIPAPVAGPGEAVVRVKAAALNHRDVWIRAGQYAGLKFPITPGSDAAGVVSAVGSEGDAGWVGREVIINPAFDWGTEERAQARNFSILGLPRNGTLAERVVVPVGQLLAKPAHLSWDQAAALPLAGVTAFRALFSRAQLRAGERVLISGVGGGAALFGLQFAVAAGAQVWVTSSSAEKIARAVTLGAAGGFDYTQPDWAATAAKAGHAFDVILDSAGGPGFNILLDLATPGGRIVFFGATRGNTPELALRKIFWRQLNLLGSTMGSPLDFRAMLDFVNQHRITPVISETFPLDRVSEAFDLMDHGGQFGKIVVSLA